MSNFPAVQASRDKFVREFSTLTNAGVGVIAARTREPYRALNIIREMAFARPQYHHRAWTMTEGWITYDPSQPEAQGIPDNVINPLEAIRAIEPRIDDRGQPVPNQTGFPDKGYYAMMWPHFAMNDNRLPPMYQMIAKYAQTLPETAMRLVLVVPYEFRVVSEIEDCVTVLDLDLPTSPELTEVLEGTFETLEDRFRPSYSEEQTERLINAGLGMTGTEFETAVSRSLVDNRSKLPNIPLDDLAQSIMDLKTEIVKRSEVLEVMPAGKMSEVGGLENLKQWVRMRKHCFTEQARAFGVDRPKGCALIGVPGSGKSLSAKAIAHELGLPLIKFDVSRVFSSLVGSSEGKVRAALKQIDAMAPCVVGSTLIKTGDGLYTVKELYDQAKVVGWSTTISEAGEVVPVELRGVVKREVTEAKRMLTIVDEDDNSITVTDNHKLLVSADGEFVWREARDLREGDQLVRE